MSILSSMATRALLTELAATWNSQASLEAVGGVEAARRVRAGEPMDIVILADGAMRALEAEGYLVPGSLNGIVISEMAAAVREGAVRPNLADAGTVRHALAAAGRIGYSTGPSGDHLLRLLSEWNIRDALGDRLVQAPPGVPVGRLLAEDAVDLAFQQRSELLGLAGVVIVGPLPAPIGLSTVFTAGIARHAPRPDAARAFISFLTSAATAESKRRHGMSPINKINGGFDNADFR